MTRNVHRNRLKSLLLACAAGASLLASPAIAQDVKAGKLMEIMVRKGLLTREEADAMIAEAAAEAAQEQAQARAQGQTPALASVPPGGVSADGTQTIPYVPQVVRDQITEQVKAQLANQAQAEGWSKPGETPEWTRRVQLYGDVRMRAEARFYDKNNGDIFTNFGAINAGDPQNINDKTPGWVAPPFLNTLQDRQRFRLRARLGVKAKIDDWISADVRLATGADNSPVSTNQTLGFDTGTGKYHIWIDRASIRLTPVKDLNVDLGRFANPFWTSDLLYDWDMNFDGLAVSGKTSLGSRFALFGTAGAFPVFNTDLNFGSRNAPVDSAASGPYESQDKYLFAAQMGIDVKPVDKVNVRLAGSYFHFRNIQGKVSALCEFNELACSTDATRPAFQQYGNSMFPIRNIRADTIDPVASPENQYFGLATGFRILNVRSAVDFAPSDSFAVRLEGDYVRNLAWSKAAVSGRAINNLGPEGREPDPDRPGQTRAVPGAYAGGNEGWQARVTLGSVLNLNWYGDWTAKPGDWNAYAGYRRLESDAVLDAFVDSDMHVGGTNHKGWFVGGNFAIGRNTILGARWLSADEIVDAPFSVDRLFVDIMTRF